MKPKVTQRDVARKARVSHVTVSLALRGHPGIPASTRERIEKIAADLGYVPDPMLSALASYRKMLQPQAYQANIAWINNFEDPQELYKYDFGEYYRGALAQSRKLGYLLEEYRVEESGQDWKQLKRVLNNKGVKAILLAPSERPNRRFELDLAEFSAVRFGYSYSYPPIHTVANSQFSTALLAMEKVIERGYRRIGLILDADVQARTGSRFFGGFVAGQQALPKALHVPPLFLRKDRDISTAIARWAGRHRVDCIISLHGRWRYQQLLDAGLRIPEEVGYADISLPADERLLSGVCQNSWLVGVLAVDLVISMLHRQEIGIPKCCAYTLAEGYWMEGATARSLNE